ncbi:MAG: hypothetical protein AAGF23_14220, partial [Acidobacteriota bacterium]
NHQTGETCKTGNSDSPTPRQRTGRTRRTLADPKALRRVADMPLDEFAEAGLIVTVESAVVDQEIVFASDNVKPDAVANRGVVYRAAELRELGKVQIEESALRLVHDIKSIFGGSVLSVEPDRRLKPRQM